MIKYLLLATFAISSFANDTFMNMKNCETIKLSIYSVLVSCHKVDYLVEYRKVEDDEKDTVKRITVITPTDQRVIKSLGK